MTETPSSTAPPAEGPPPGYADPAGRYAAMVVAKEDPAWLEALHARLIADHQPTDATEEHLVWRLASAIWRSDRAARMEAEVLNSAWTPARLRAIIRYQAQQQREIKETLRLLDRSRATRVARSEERAGGHLGRIQSVAQEAAADIPLGPVDLASIAAWLDNSAIQHRRDRSRLDITGVPSLATLGVYLDGRIAANLNLPSASRPAQPELPPPVADDDEQPAARTASPMKLPA